MSSLGVPLGIHPVITAVIPSVIHTKICLKILAQISQAFSAPLIKAFENFPGILRGFLADIARKIQKK